MRIIRIIDRGGFGRVEEVELHRGVHAARKVFDPQIHLTPDDLAKMRVRFKREIQVQSSLPPHIALPIICKDLQTEFPWYVMPLADRNYWQQIQADRTENTITVQPIADMLNALEELHTLGFVHRDIKPENILLHEGKWKLSDFGLVMITEAMSDRLTSTSSVWGTRLYMAPEQYTGFRDVTAAADIYSVGCILHDLVVGNLRIPFQQVTCDGPLGPILEKCTERDPNRRFADIRKLRDAIFVALAPPTEEPGEGPASQWLIDLPGVSSWTVEKLEAFVRFLRKLDPHSETASAICNVIDEDALGTFYQLDHILWASLTEFYFEWTKQNFSFSYCDVIVTRLRKIFDLGNPTQKAKAVLAAAQLGHSHNRWYVMQHVLSMAGPHLDEPVAQRLAIEIVVNDAHADLIACAEEINHTPDEYHPVIARILLRSDRSV